MGAEARAQIIAELVDEYAEERVRQYSTQVFDLAAVKRSLRESLKDGDAGFDLGPGDDATLAGLLDRHPFLIRVAGTVPSWKPGLDKAPTRRPARP